MRRHLRGAAILACAAIAFAGTAAGQAQPVSATTHHQVNLAGARLGYTAIVSEVPLDGPDGKPAGIGTATAYVRDGADPAGRPIVFVFNGGPGASSSPLHLAFGPRTILPAAPGAPQPVVDNPETLLATADLVFIDPVGTGYSRPLPGALPGSNGASFWSVFGDARSVAVIIRSELQRLGRARSPLYLMGESYGGVRAATILHLAKDLRFAGVILLSPALDLTGTDTAPGNDLPYVLDTPSYAAVAWSLGRGAKAPDAVAAFEAGERFAEGEYAAALMQGDSLDAGERARVAHGLSVLIGVPQAVIEAHDLRIDVETFRRAILADKGQITGRLDGRTLGPLATYGVAKPPGDDPAMSGPGHASPRLALDRYYRTELAFPAPAEPYKTLDLEVNAAWRWDFEDRGSRFFADVAPYVGEAMRADPELRVYAAGGLYDLATPFGATTYALNHAGAPPARVRITHFPSGHMMEDDPASLHRLGTDITAFIASSAEAAR